MAGLVRETSDEHGRRPGRGRRPEPRPEPPVGEDGHQLGRPSGAVRERRGQRPASRSSASSNRTTRPPASVDELAAVAVALRPARCRAGRGRSCDRRPPVRPRRARRRRTRRAAPRASRRAPASATTVERSVEKTSVPETASASTLTVSPGENSPLRSARASGFSTRRWIVRFSGRAPYAGSVPSRTISRRAAGVRSIRQVLFSRAAARGPRGAARRSAPGRRPTGRGRR